MIKWLQYDTLYLPKRHISKRLCYFFTLDFLSQLHARSSWRFDSTSLRRSKGTTYSSKRDIIKNCVGGKSDSIFKFGL